MTISSSASSAAGAAQGDPDGVRFPPIAPLAVILATIAANIYILIKNDDGDLDLEVPVSPS